MENFDEHIDESIARYLAGMSTPEEDAALQAWIATSSENRRYFADLQEIWKRSPDMRPSAERAVDTEAALEKVKKALRRNKSGARPQTLRLLPLWRAAAAVLLLAVAGYFIWQRNLSSASTVIAASDTTLTDTLTDGSVITLAPQSGLAVAKNFNTRERRVRLRGEGRFKVTPDTTRPFIVETAGLEVRVVGTEFTVDDVTDPNSVLIAVSEGRVRVSAAGSSLLLQAGEGARYDKRSGILTPIEPAYQNPAQNRMLWFDATPLREVVQQVEKKYGITIVLKNKSLEDCLLTARYNNLPKEKVLDLIAESFSLQLTKTNNETYALDGPGCGE